jgi:hypothetical protein
MEENAKKPLLAELSETAALLAAELGRAVAGAKEAGSKIFSLDARVKAAERSNSPGLEELKEELERARAEWSELEGEAEALKGYQYAIGHLTDLLASCIRAGTGVPEAEAALWTVLAEAGRALARRREAQARPGGQAAQDRGDQVSQAAQGGDQPGGRAGGQAGQPPQPAQDARRYGGSASGTFTVLEARETKTPGVVRAYCEAEDGSKVAVFGKNGSGQALAQAVKKKVQVEYRQGEKGLIALSVRLAG